MGDKGFGEFGMDESGWLSGVMDRLGAQLLVIRTAPTDEEQPTRKGNDGRNGLWPKL